MKRNLTGKAARIAGLSLATLLVLSPGAAFAQAEEGTADPAVNAQAPSSNAMVNLVRLLVARGTLSREEGDMLIGEAEQEARQAMANSAAAPVVAANGLPAAPTGTIRVPYIPETVRDQIRDELREEVLAQARTEGWSAPAQAAPAWVHRVNLTGDVRLRSESSLQSSLNSNQIPNFAAIVAGGPLDLINDPIPLLNATTDRYNQLRVRARLGLSFEVDPRLRVGLMLASGNDRSPVSTNATLGGGFGKRDLFLHEAFIEARPFDSARVIAGRFPNPFRSTDAMFDNDLRFDGAAAEVGLRSLRSEQDFNLVLRGGAFPLDFGSRNFPETAVQKVEPAQQYLFSAQAEGTVTVFDGIRLRAAAAYHDFVNLQGRPSEPCALYLGVTQCSTDGTAASFVQKGNTLSFIRRIVLNPNAPSSTVQPQPQLLGRVMDYNVLDLLGEVSVPVADGVQARLTGNYLRNLAFDRADVCRFGIAGQPVNNGVEVDYTGDGIPDSNGNICAATNPTRFVGGGTGYLALASIGHPVVSDWGDWRVFGGYKYLESDAVLDAFTDDDFHLGGTNAKGYFVGGEIGILHGLTLGGRWLSANAVAGDPLAIDVLQIDLEAKF